MNPAVSPRSHVAPCKTPSIWRRFQTQLSVVFALAIHDIRLHSKKAKLGFFWELFDPISQVAFWFVLYTVMAGPPKIYDMTTFLFLGTGIIGFLLFADLAQTLPRFVGKQKGFLRFPVVRQVDFLMAGFVKEATTLAIVALIVWGSVVLFGLGFAPADPLGVITAATALTLLGWSFGCFNTMVLVLVPLYDKFLSILFRVMFFTSGAIIPLDVVPPQARQYLFWNPVVHGIEQLRSAWSYTFDSADTSNWYVFIWSGTFMFLALLLDHHGLRARTE
jgi:capsular polysaccharide transport system permease protein